MANAILRKNGGADGNKLEPENTVELLEELEDWSIQIQSDPAVVRALKAILSGSADTPNEVDNIDHNSTVQSKRSSRHGGPRP